MAKLNLDPGTFDLKEPETEEQTSTAQTPASLYLNKGFTTKGRERRTEQLHFYTTPSLAQAVKDGAKANNVSLNEYINEILEATVGGKF